MKVIFASLVTAAAFYALPAMAQQPKANCKNPQTQMEFTMCAGEALAAADKALNAQYVANRKLTKARDAEAEEDQRGYDAALVKAQRSWVAYRDAWCESWAFQSHGGSMEPQLDADCQADLTRKRTAELKALADNM